MVLLANEEFSTRFGIFQVVNFWNSEHVSGLLVSKNEGTRRAKGAWKRREAGPVGMDPAHGEKAKAHPIRTRSSSNRSDVKTYKLTLQKMPFSGFQKTGVCGDWKLVNQTDLADRLESDVILRARRSGPHSNKKRTMSPRRLIRPSDPKHEEKQITMPGVGQPGLANLPLETRLQILNLLASSGDLDSARRAGSSCRSIRAAYASLILWSRIAEMYKWTRRGKAPVDAVFVIAKLQSKDLHVCEQCLLSVTYSYAVEISKDIFKRYCLSCVESAWDDHPFVRQTSLASQEWIDACTADDDDQQHPTYTLLSASEDDESDVAIPQQLLWVANEFEALLLEYEAFGGKAGRDSRYRVAIDSKRELVLKYVSSKIKQVENATELELDWAGYSDDLNDMTIFSDHLVVGHKILARLVHESAQSDLREFKPALKIADDRKFSFLEPRDGKNNFKTWLTSELERKKAFASRDAQAWSLFKSVKDRAKAIGIDSQIKKFLALRMVKQGTTDCTQDLLDNILAVTEIEHAAGLELPKSLSSDIITRRVNAVSKLVANRVAPGPLQTFAQLASIELPVLSDELRTQVNAKIKEEMHRVAECEIKSLLCRSLQSEPDSPFSIKRLLKSKPLRPKKIAAALPPQLSVLFPLQLEAEWISTKLPVFLKETVESVALDRVGAFVKQSEPVLPDPILSVALGLSSLHAFRKWIRSLFPRGQDISKLLDRQGGWLDDLLAPDEDTALWIAKSALERHGYPLSLPKKNGFKGKSVEKVNNAVEGLVRDILERNIRDRVEAMEFREPLELVRPQLEMTAFTNSNKITCDPDLLESMWDKLVAERVVRELDTNFAHLIEWICTPLRALELENPKLAEQVQQIEDRPVYKQVREAVSRSHTAEQLVAIQEQVEALSLTTLQKYSRSRIPKSLLQELKLPADYRKLDHKWREAVARRFYLKTVDHPKTHFRKILIELGAGGRERKKADSGCSCGFVGSQRVPREFIARNHWCVDGAIWTLNA